MVEAGFILQSAQSVSGAVRSTQDTRLTMTRTEN
jgi:hypothetical protein